MNLVIWGIFWKVFRRSCGRPTRSVGPTDRSAGLLVGRTNLSGATVSLVGRDPGVPMSHTHIYICIYMYIYIERVYILGA
jgi:hypothetical protein